VIHCLAIPDWRHRETHRRAQDRNAALTRPLGEVGKGLLVAAAELLLDGGAARLVLLGFEERRDPLGEIVNQFGQRLAQFRPGAARKLHGPRPVGGVEVVHVDPVIGGGALGGKGAETARLRRSDRVAEPMQEMIARGTVMIATRGSVVGQVNGLTVASLGAARFGWPARITARVRLGAGQVVDIEREVKLGGPIHSKGVLVLSGYLSTHYLPEMPLSLWAFFTALFGRRLFIASPAIPSMLDPARIPKATGNPSRSAPLRPSARPRVYPFDSLPKRNRLAFRCLAGKCFAGSEAVDRTTGRSCDDSRMPQKPISPSTAKNGRGEPTPTIRSGHCKLDPNATAATD
jgi:hypothetical protein